MRPGCPDGVSATSTAGPCRTARAALATSRPHARADTVTQYIPAGSDETAWFASFYLQDQWTLNRFTFSGALRYDNAQSKFGKTCVGPDVLQRDSVLPERSGERRRRARVCTSRTSRRAGAWPGTCSATARRPSSSARASTWTASQAGGIYTATNPAAGGRTSTSYTRTWRDIDGDRIVDCDLGAAQWRRRLQASRPTANAAPRHGRAAGIRQRRRFGRSPDALDELGLAIGLGTIYCGQDEPSMSAGDCALLQQLLRRGRQEPARRVGQAPVRVADVARRAARAAAALPAEVTYNRRQVVAIRQSVT